MSNQSLIMRMAGFRNDLVFKKTTSMLRQGGSGLPEVRSCEMAAAERPSSSNRGWASSAAKSWTLSVEQIEKLDHFAAPPRPEYDLERTIRELQKERLGESQRLFDEQMKRTMKSLTEDLNVSDNLDRPVPKICAQDPGVFGIAFLKR